MRKFIVLRPSGRREVLSPRERLQERGAAYSQTEGKGISGFGKLKASFQQPF